MPLEMVQKPGIHSYYVNAHQNRQNMNEREGSGEKTSQDCWKVMTTAEKVLLALLVFSLLLLVGLSAFIVSHFLKGECPSPNELTHVNVGHPESNCATQACVEETYKLLKAIDRHTDPCSDFDQYVCGNHVQTEEETRVDWVDDDFNDDDSVLLTTVKKFYRACTDTTEIEKDDAGTLSILLAKIGGWPLLMGQKWRGDNFNWLQFMAELRLRGIRSDWLLSFDYYKDWNGINLLLINPPRLKRKLFKNDYYEEIIAELTTILNGTEPVLEQLSQIRDFEDKLYTISHDNWEILLNGKGDYTKYNMTTLNGPWPQELLVDIFNKLTHGYAVFTNSTTVVVASEKYIFWLHDLLAKTPKRTQANYFIWKIIESYLPYLSDHIRNVYGEFIEIARREDHCHDETVRRFHSVIEKEYMRKHKSESTLSLINLTVNLIYQSYNDSDDAATNVVIEGPEGQDSGVENFEFTSRTIVKMLNEVQFHIESEFYKCLHKKAESCAKEGYYENTERFETHFDTADKTMHLPYNLVYSESFMWDQPNYINFAKIGRIIGDKIIEAEKAKHNTTVNKVGVDLAYLGYLKWLQINGMETRLQVLDYSIQQLFWIHSGLTHCSSDDDLKKFEEITQSQYFRRDFQCG